MNRAAIAAEALAAWDTGEVTDLVEIHPGRVFRVDRGAGAPLLLKDIGADRPEVARRYAFEVDVLHHLHHRGVPVAVPLPTREGQPCIAREGQLYTLSPYLATDNRWLTLDLAGLTRLNRACGAAIGKLHAALAAYPTEGLAEKTWTTVFPDDFYARSIPVIRQHLRPDERAPFDALIDALTAELQALPQGLPTQLIHRDCHHGNIVVAGEQVSGFVDCDHLSLGPRLFDLADFIVHMIKHAVADRQQTDAWFQLFPAVVQGYESELPLLPVERQTLPYAMLGILLMLAWWFFQTGEPDKARAEIAALAWMHGNRHRIRILIAKAQPQEANHA